MMKTIAFTGTRSGMNGRQMINLFKALTQLKFIEGELTAYHGGCIGADMEFHYMCKALGIIIEVFPGHPANNPNDKRFRGEYFDADVIHESDTHFSRNRKMVTAAQIIFSTPYGPDNGKGGTWYTINYAKSIKKTIYVYTR